MKWNYYTTTILGLALATSSLLSCKKKDPTDGSATPKNISWTTFYEGTAGESIESFEISDDAKWLFYALRTGEVFRVNTSTGSKERLLAQPLEYHNGKLYTYSLKSYKAYIGVSDDNGATIREYLVGTYTNYAAGWYTGAFIAPRINRFYVLDDGTLMMPHVMRSGDNARFLADNKLIAFSKDGGATWERKETDNSFIACINGNTFYAINEGWTGVRPSVVFRSTDQGSNWQEYAPQYRAQAVDREQRLIAGGDNSIQRSNGSSWQTFTWSGTEVPSVQLSGLVYEGTRGDDPNGRRVDDLEFDQDNNLYAISKDRRSICKTRLD